jgi:hypothetical protein
MTLQEITAALQQQFPQGAVLVIVPAAGSAPVQAARTGSAAAYSREELDILAVLNREIWCTRKEISKVTGLSAEGDLRVILRNLVARGVLESSTSKGYRLAVDVPGEEEDSGSAL